MEKIFYILGWVLFYLGMVVLALTTSLQQYLTVLTIITLLSGVYMDDGRGKVYIIIHLTISLALLLITLFV